MRGKCKCMEGIYGERDGWRAGEDVRVKGCVQIGATSGEREVARRMVSKCWTWIISH